MSTYDDYEFMREGGHYYDDDGNELFPHLHPKPELCVSCVSNALDNPFEEICCNLTRLDWKEGEEFICYGYRAIKP